MYHAGKNLSINLQDRTIEDFQIGVNAQVGFRVNTNGNAQESIAGGAYTNFDAWLELGDPADAEVQCSYVGDAPGGSATNTWLACTANRTWTLSATPGDTNTSTLTIEFRPAGGGVIDTATIVLSAAAEI